MATLSKPLVFILKKSEIDQKELDQTSTTDTEGIL
jgi:hypothetical protein